MAASMKHILSLQTFKGCDVILKSVIRPSIYFTPKLQIAKHYDPKFRRNRRDKILWFDRKRFMNADRMTEDEERMVAKKEGRRYPKQDQVAGRLTDTINIGESAVVFDDYVPPEGDGRISHLVLSVTEEESFIRKRLERTQQNFRTKRTLKKYETNFNKKELAMDLQSLYIHTIKLTNELKKNVEEMAECATSFCINSFQDDFLKRTVKWEYIETVEPPKILGMSTREMTVKDNLITQITVRIHSKQKLAVYDQFGRLMLGDPNLEKTVLEYVIFEKHVIDTYGKWRVHAKLHPEWMKQKGSIVNTIKIPKQKVEEDEAE